MASLQNNVLDCSQALRKNRGKTGSHPALKGPHQKVLKT